MDAAGADLAVAYPGIGGGGQVWLYSSILAPTTPTLNPATTQKITGPLTFGSSLTFATVDTGAQGDTTLDFLSGTNLSSGNSAWLIYQRGSFETTNVGFSFWTSRFDGTVVTTQANSRLGSASVLSDISGDGDVDVILGDSQLNEVRLWK